MKKITLLLLFLTATSWNVASWNVASWKVDADFNAASNAYAQEESLDFSALDDSESAPSASAVEEAPLPDVDSSDAQIATNPASNAKESKSSERAKFVDLVLAGGWIGFVLLISSILAVSLIIRLCLTLRRSTLAPADLTEEISPDVKSGSYRSAFEKASQNDSFLGRALACGLRETDRGWHAVEKAIEDALADETAALYRRTDPLSVIGNVAPMLGLLGTVIGMVSTFGELAVDDASGRNLANGIYFALVTTVDGLIVAIPVLVAHSLLNARIAGLVSFVAGRIDDLLEPVKRELDSQVVRATETVLTNAATSTNATNLANAANRANVSSRAPASTSKVAPETAGNVASSLSAEDARSKKTFGLREVARRSEPEASSTRPTLSLKNRTAPDRAPETGEA